MLGAIIGDIAGSRFEHHNHLSRNFHFLADSCHFTDDSVMTIAVADALLKCNGNWDNLSRQAVKSMQTIGRKYPDCGYGYSFYQWIHSDQPIPYNSYGNGSAMRISPVAWVAETPEECRMLSEKISAVSHNHPEGIKGAEAAAMATWLALHGADKNEIRKVISRDYYPLDFTIDGLRPDYTFSASCQGSVPQAIEAFLEGKDFENTVRTAVSLGGDSDTIAAIAGGIAEAFYGIPDVFRDTVLNLFLDSSLSGIVKNFEEKYSFKKSVRRKMYETSLSSHS